MKKKTLIIIIIAISVVVLVVAGYILCVNRYAKNKHIAHVVGILESVENGEEPLWGEKMYCERAILLSGGVGYSDSDFDIQGTVYADDSAGIEKVEIKIAMGYDYIQYKENYEKYILKTIDITDRFLPDTAEDDISKAYNGDFKKYKFDVNGTLTEEDGFNKKRMMDYVIVITFADGYEALLFNSPA